MTVTEIQLKCAYWNCQFNSKDTIYLENNIKVKHVVDKLFKYQDTNEETECPNYDIVFLRKVCEGYEYMSEHTSEVRGRVLGGGVHASESESES